MLEQLIKRIQSSADAVKISFQDSQFNEEKLSEEEIANHIEKLFTDENMINIDEQDLSILKQLDEIKVRLIEFETPQFDKKYLPAFKTLKNLDCAIVNVESSPEFSLDSFYQISRTVEHCCHKDAPIIMGSNLNSHNQLQLFILGGYGAIDKAIKPISTHKPVDNSSIDYYDNELVKQFMVELRQNPAITIAALQRKYSLGFNRVAHNLEIAREQVQQNS